MAYAVPVLFSFYTTYLIIYKPILIRLKKNLQSLPKRLQFDCKITDFP